jgi:hypothetical protein
LSDLLIQKIFKTIDRLDGSVPGTVRDRILEAEKKGIITSAANLLEIRDVRNTIGLEYEFNDLSEIVNFVFRHSYFLINTLENVKLYSGRFYN